jgi:16S rRNA (adenine1518-N6/adenine1519-N6)-dimethyltransferase
MKLSEMRAVLTARGIHLSKSLGQNFLHDGNQLRRIVEAAEVTRKDKVIEIGPGLGPLTERLVECAGEVLAIEKDARLVEVLQERFVVGQASRLPSLRPSAGHEEIDPTTSVRAGETPALLLLHDDALAFLRREPRDWSDWKLVANLPYSVASPILVELAQAHGRPQRIVATLQLEVARRLMAKSGEGDYGVLTLLIQLDYEPRDWFKIPASCFFPAPDVDSACVVLVRRARALLNGEDRQSFLRIVKRGFSQRRKMMMKLLKKDWPEDRLAVAFERLNLSPQVRAEAISLEQFIELARVLHP